MEFKQTQNELYANVRALYEIIKPAKLAIIPTNGMTLEQTGYARDNGALFDLWIQKNIPVVDGVLDYSVPNLRLAYKALRDTGLLKFEVAPAPQTQKNVYGAQERGLRNHANPEEYERDPSKDVVALAKKAALNAAAEELFGQCMSEIQNFSGRTHSATARGREILKSILDKALAGGKGNLNPAIAAKCLEDIQARCRTLWE